MTKPNKNKIKFLSTILKLGLLSVLLFATILTVSNFHEEYLYDVKGSSVVKVLQGRGGGTGWSFTTKSGRSVIITNAHVCGNSQTVRIKHQNSLEMNANVIKVDKSKDLCAIEGFDNIPSLKIAKDVKKHEKLWIVGHPRLKPLAIESGRYVDEEIVDIVGECSKEREQSLIKCTDNLECGEKIEDILVYNVFSLCVERFNSMYINLISYPGNSGSPILNKFGNVVGVLFAGTNGAANMSYAVPLQTLKTFVNNLK